MERSISESEYYNPQVRVVPDETGTFTYANVTPHHSATSSESVNGGGSALGGSRENVMKLDSGFSTNESNSLGGSLGIEAERANNIFKDRQYQESSQPLNSFGSANAAASFGSMSISSLNEQKIRPGEFVMRVLFAEFTSQAEKKIDAVMIEPPVCKICL